MRVLSIDFDWVMEPCIEVYNTYTHAPCPLGPQGAWYDIEKKIPIIHSLNLEMNYNKYRELYILIQKILKQNPNILIAIKNNHSEILPIIQSQLTEKDLILKITNIDHHHDCGYREEDYTNLCYCGCDNWVMYASRYPNIQSFDYQWINNQNSDLKIIAPLPHTFTYNFSTNLASINTCEKFDIIFICSSWEWVPMKYEPLFDLLCNMILDAGEKI